MSDLSAMTHRLISIAAWAVVAVIVFATLSPLNLRPHMSDNANVERFTAFAAAGLFLGLAYPQRFLLIVVFTIALAFGLEALQQFAIERHGHFQDASIKAGGGLAGLFVAGLFLKFRTKVR